MIFFFKIAILVFAFAPNAVYVLIINTALSVIVFCVGNLIDQPYWNELFTLPL